MESQQVSVVISLRRYNYFLTPHVCSSWPEKKLATECVEWCT